MKGLLTRFVCTKICKFYFIVGFKEAWTKRLNPQDIQTSYKKQGIKFNSGTPDVDHDTVSK